MINGDGKWGNAGLHLGDDFLCVEIDDRSLVVEGERNNSQAPALSIRTNAAKRGVLSCQVRAVTRLPSVTQGLST